MKSTLSPLLLRLLRDPQAAFPEPSAEAHAEALLRRHVMTQLSSALSSRGERALVVKGAALGLTVYPQPAARPMKDIDLVVPPRRERAVLSALSAAGMQIQRDPARPESASMLETQLFAPAGALRVLVEVHASLDKIAPRPIDPEELLGRATVAPGLPSLLLPDPIDHALLVVQHAASHEFRHTLALLDFELLLRSGLDRAELSRRARAFGLVTATFVLLSALHTLGAASVTDALVRAFDPGLVRRAALRPFYDLDAYPVARRKAELGARWILGQTPLRDDLGAWTRGVLRYGAVRAKERIHG
ncbi:nucleotidyltransferase family protein [Polyangium aurulentum]|uniref:nucleotidyltransferase family protein n=1 Tax=Polyangium aurulentum TaxID=2567896 RepID=UPI0010AEC601|nr:nucleotidyltransferase family protein [Polyangium aurulentum]UQA55314.1 nucleotidyltransferase family protein [Polyangium aurulentum]